MDEMLTRPILLLALAMVLAIGIERLLELLRAARDYFEARSDSYGKKWEQKANSLRERVEARLDNAKGTNASSFQTVLIIVCRQLSPSPNNKEGLLSISVDKVRSMSIRVRYKILSIALGIGFAFVFQIDILELVKISTEHSNTELASSSEDINRTIHGMVISGIAMGFGAGPVHKLITAMEKARKSRA